MATVKQRDSFFRAYLVSAAIDIGTSSSCFAFCFRSSPDNIRLNTDLGGQESPQSYKRRTTVLTKPGSNGDFVAFGEEAETMYREMIMSNKVTDYNLYTDFKMILYREQNVSRTETMVTSKIGTQRPLMDLYVMTLQHLVRKLNEDIDRTGCSKIYPREIRWILCVPATWTDSAKDFLRHAAFKAGMIENEHSSQLLILLEATAAALYCTRRESRWSAHHLESDEAMPPGTKYLVIDAGAGTVDYTAQETRKSKGAKEITIPKGGDWGGRRVDKQFLGLLQEVLGERFINAFISNYPLHSYEFEQTFEQAKTSVVDCNSKLTLPLNIMMERFMRKSFGKNIEDVINSGTSSHGVSERAGYLVIKPKTIQELFDPAIDQITEYTKSMVDSEELKDLDRIFLVGGFASCKLLQKRMKRQFSDYKIAVPTDARSAVVQGAVIYGVNPGIVTLVSTKTYGAGTCSFIPEAISSRGKSPFNPRNYCADLFRPFVQKGEALEPGTEASLLVYRITDAEELTIDFYSMDRPTKPGEMLFTNAEDIQKVALVKVCIQGAMKGLSRKVSLQFSIGNEIKVVATDLSSNSSQDVHFDFDYALDNKIVPRQRTQRTDDEIVYEERELEQLYSSFIDRVNEGRVRAPSFVQGVQLQSTSNKIYIYVDKASHDEGKQFVQTQFPLCQNAKAVPINPFKFFYTCGFCGKEDCPSQTGDENKEIDPKEWIGAGSPILAISTEHWNEIRSSKISCLEDVIQLCKAKREHINKMPGATSQAQPLWARWTLGYHSTSENNQQHVLTTVAHPLVSLGYTKQTTFLTEVRSEAKGKNEVVVLGGKSKGACSKENTIVDILQIQVSKELDPKMLQNKVKSCCDKIYHKVDLDFSQLQSSTLHTEVTKRGIKTGNTYGKIVVENHFHVPSVTGKRTMFIEAIAVSSLHPPFAVEGDSGSLVLESFPDPKSPRAFGLVSGGMDMYVKNENNGEELKECVICVKIEKSLIDLVNHSDGGKYQAHGKIKHIATYDEK